MNNGDMPNKPMWNTYETGCMVGILRSSYLYWPCPKPPWGLTKRDDNPMSCNVGNAEVDITAIYRKEPYAINGVETGMHWVECRMMSLMMT